MKYDVIQRGSLEDLVAAINDKIDDGWTPIGGVSVARCAPSSPAGLRYSQAIIVEEEDDE